MSFANFYARLILGRNITGKKLQQIWLFLMVQHAHGTHDFKMRIEGEKRQQQGGFVGKK